MENSQLHSHKSQESFELSKAAKTGESIPQYKAEGKMSTREPSNYFSDEEFGDDDTDVELNVEQEEAMMASAEA